MSVLIVQRAIARGSRPFPVDMLRYDACYPERGEDAAVIAGSFGRGKSDALEIRLERRVLRVGSTWTPERWRSFGWTLVPAGETTRR